MGVGRCEHFLEIYQTQQEMSQQYHSSWGEGDGERVSSRTRRWLDATGITLSETADWARLCDTYPRQQAALWRLCASSRTESYRRIVQCVLDAGDGLTYEDLDEMMGEFSLSRAKLSKRTTRLAEAGVIAKGGCPVMIDFPDSDLRVLSSMILRYIEDFDCEEV